MARPETEALERHLAAAAETVTIKRRIGTGANDFVTITARARISGYQSHEVIGGIEVTDSKFILSAVPFSGVTWPGAAGGGRFPRRGDWIVSHGRDRHIEQCEPITIGDEVVRLEGRIR